MAKKPTTKKPAAKKASGAKPKVRSEFKMIGKGALRDLLDKCSAPASKMDTLRGQIGGHIAAAVNDFNLHKKMFGWIRWLDKADDLKRAEALYHFDLMRDHVGLDQKSTADMFRKQQAVAAKEAEKAAKAEAKNGKDDTGASADMKSGAVSLDAKRAEKEAATKATGELPLAEATGTAPLH